MRDTFNRGRGQHGDSLCDITLPAARERTGLRNESQLWAEQLKQGLHELGFLGRIIVGERSTQYLGKWPIRPAEIMISVRSDDSSALAMEICHLKSGHTIALSITENSVNPIRAGVILMALSKIPEGQWMDALKILREKLNVQLQVYVGESFEFVISQSGLKIYREQGKVTDLTPEEAIQGAQTIRLSLKYGQRLSQLNIKVIPGRGVTLCSRQGDESQNQESPLLFLTINQALSAVKTWLDSTSGSSAEDHFPVKAAFGSVRNQVLGRTERMLSERLGKVQTS